ncbi:MAG: 4-hydroxy-tetrahydrodipicolinate synthase [Clostridia bacterium]|nr:4-hydroxy-tetrahydrodipicolinate synthase [Clostridia bacterium]
MFKGAYTALVTPFKDGKINYNKMAELIEFQINEGIDGLVVCGTTGESATLSDKEKRRLIKFTVETVNGRVPVIAGTGSNNTIHTIKLSKFAEKVGVDGLLLVTPYYNKSSQNGLIAHFRAIAESVTTPCILYNVPSRTGVNLLPDTVVKLAETENIVGIKEASGNFSQLLELMAKVPKDFIVLSGNDDSIVPLLSIGGKGVISVLSNIYPKDTHNMCQAFFLGETNYAKELQLRYASLIKALFIEPNPMPVKDAMNILDMDVGNTRLPLVEVSDDTHEILKSVLYELKDK